MLEMIRRSGAAVAVVFAIGLGGAPALDAATVSPTITSNGSPGALAAARSEFMGNAVTMDLSNEPLCGNAGALSTNVGSFSRGAGSRDGSGASICGNFDALQVKSELDPVPYGRHNPPTRIGRWVDSNDLEYVDWVIDTNALGMRPLVGLEFALIDAHDQPNSWFDMFVGNASWSIDEREPDGTVHWVTLLFDKPTDFVSIRMETRRNDGYGVAKAVLAPIPLPPAALLVISGFLLMAGVGYRSKRQG